MPDQEPDTNPRGTAPPPEPPDILGDVVRRELRPVVNAIGHLTDRVESHIRTEAWLPVLAVILAVLAVGEASLALTRPANAAPTPQPPRCLDGGRAAE